MVTTAVEDGIGWITLDRPEAMNAITVEVGAALDRALAELAKSARVIVVRGAGGNFCVGGDFKELERLRGEGVGAMRELFENFARACARIATLPVPVIHAVEGYALAGGFEPVHASSRSWPRTRSWATTTRTSGWCRVAAARSGCRD